ncbi:MAG: hypothetical protein M9894_39960 [Planctomycetes bacterium]|nr:hypothetical protein [Planctomycetota bacterium]
MIRELAKDILVRRVRENFPDGWDTEEAGLSRRAAALGDWTAEILVHAGEHTRSSLHAVSDAIKRSAGPGWRPEGPDDPLVYAAFEEGWPSC